MKRKVARQKRSRDSKVSGVSQATVHRFISFVRSHVLRTGPWQLSDDSVFEAFVNEVQHGYIPKDSSQGPSIARARMKDSLQRDEAAFGELPRTVWDILATDGTMPQTSRAPSYFEQPGRTVFDWKPVETLARAFVSQLGGVESTFEARLRYFIAYILVARANSEAALRKGFNDVWQPSDGPLGETLGHHAQILRSVNFILSDIERGHLFHAMERAFFLGFTVCQAEVETERHAAIGGTRQKQRAKQTSRAVAAKYVPIHVKRHTAVIEEIKLRKRNRQSTAIRTVCADLSLKNATLGTPDAIRKSYERVRSQLRERRS